MAAGSRDAQLQTNTAAAGEDSVNRPWWMWCVGWIDILSAVYHAGLVVYFAYCIFTNASSDPGENVLMFFLQLVAVAARVIQGLAIFIGLKSNDDSNTLWYCKFWSYCQCGFLVVSIIQLLYYGISYKVQSSKQSESTELSKTVILFVLRLLSLIFVADFMRRLKLSLDRMPGNREWREFTQMSNQMDDAERVRENALCEPTMALLLSM